ncbi:putative transferase [Helianthus anomalus]
MIQTVKAITTAGELLDHGVGWAALWLHEAVASHGDKNIKEVMEAWMKSPFVVNPSVHFEKNSVHMGSSPRFDMYGNEFGLGKAMAVLSGYTKFDGKVTSYPGREGRGSIDLEVCLLPENMAAFESDEEFLSIVNE